MDALVVRLRGFSMSVARALASPRRSGAGVDASRKSKFRPEIQGLRSLAVLMVVSYHVWFGRVSGGVDVFLLISAFLMTLQFVGKYEQGRPMALFKHWLHLFRRLLAAAVTVIIAVLAASYLFLPRHAGWTSSLRAGRPCSMLKTGCCSRRPPTTMRRTTALPVLSSISGRSPSRDRSLSSGR